MNDMVVSDSGLPPGLLAELGKQLKLGLSDPKKGLHAVQLQRFLDRQNPFDLSIRSVLGATSVPYELLIALLTALRNGVDEPLGLKENHLRALLEHRNPFDLAQFSAVLSYADERVVSSFGYSAGFRFRTTRVQVEDSLRLFPHLDASYVNKLVIDNGNCHAKAEFTAVIPKWQSVANTYGEALMIVVALLEKLYGDKFKNYRGEKLTDEYVRLVEKTAQAYQQLGASQPGDFLVFDAQFGERWAGASIRHGRVRYLQEEFGLGPYEVGILLLTHPDRITGENQLYIDCSGVEHRADPKAVFSLCLRFGWSGIDQRLGLNYGRIGFRGKRWGAASGFLPQCPRS